MASEVAPAAASAAPKRGRTCLEEAELADARPAGKKQLRRQNTEQQVTKAIKDNCRVLTATETDGTIVDGLTLRERLIHDKRAVRLGTSSETFGRKYYEDLRATYSGSDSIEKQLICGDS